MAGQQPGHLLAQEGLAGAGRAVQQDGALRVHRRAQLVAQRGLHDDACQGRIHRGAVHAHRGDTLRLHAGGICAQRHWRGADVGAVGQSLQRAGAAQRGELELHVAVELSAATHLDQVLSAQVLQQFVEQRHAQAQVLRDLLQVAQRVKVHHLEQQVDQQQ